MEADTGPQCGPLSLSIIDYTYLSVRTRLELSESEKLSPLLSCMLHAGRHALDRATRPTNKTKNTETQAEKDIGRGGKGLD